MKTNERHHNPRRQPNPRKLRRKKKGYKHPILAVFNYFSLGWVAALGCEVRWFHIIFTSFMFTNPNRNGFLSQDTIICRLKPIDKPNGLGVQQIQWLVLCSTSGIQWLIFCSLKHWLILRTTSGILWLILWDTMVDIVLRKHNIGSYYAPQMGYNGWYCAPQTQWSRNSLPYARSTSAKKEVQYPHRTTRLKRGVTLWP